MGMKKLDQPIALDTKGFGAAWQCMGKARSFVIGKNGALVVTIYTQDGTPVPETYPGPDVLLFDADNGTHYSVQAVGNDGYVSDDPLIEEYITTKSEKTANYEFTFREKTESDTKTKTVTQSEDFSESFGKGSNATILTNQATIIKQNEDILANQQTTLEAMAFMRTQISEMQKIAI